jgi:hypothetical protein
VPKITILPQGWASMLASRSGERRGAAGRMARTRLYRKGKLEAEDFQLDAVSNKMKLKGCGE